MLEQTVWSLLAAVFLITSKESKAVRRVLTVVSILLLIRDSLVEAESQSETVLYQLQWRTVTTIKGALLIGWRMHNKLSIYSNKL